MNPAVILLTLSFAVTVGRAASFASDGAEARGPQATAEQRIRGVRFVADPAIDTGALKDVLEDRERRIRIEGLVDEPEKMVTGSNEDLPVERLCTCLREAKRAAEAHGRIDFAVELEVPDANGGPPAAREANPVDLTARVRTGRPYRVGRITFTGHYRINESTLRRAMVLQEQALFDVDKLRRSVARLNRSGLMAPITADDIAIRRDPVGLTADVTISLRERPRGRWWLSGPLTAPFIGSLQAAISSRLPAWGRGPFEASTYYVTFGLIGLPNPLARLMPSGAKRGLSPSLVLERPYLPGQALSSGFALSARRPLPAMLASYGATQLGRGARAVLGNDAPLPPSLVMPVQTSRPNAEGKGSFAGFLICEPQKPRLQWLRRGGALAADLMLGAFRPF